MENREEIESSFTSHRRLVQESPPIKRIPKTSQFMCFDSSFALEIPSVQEKPEPEIKQQSLTEAIGRILAADIQMK